MPRFAVAFSGRSTMVDHPTASRPLHYLCSRAGKFRTELEIAARAGGTVSLSSEAAVKLLANAVKILAVIEVDPKDLLQPSGIPMIIVPVAQVMLPPQWAAGLRAQAELEPNPDTRRSVKSKVRWAVWNLQFASLVASIEHQVAALIVPQVVTASLPKTKLNRSSSKRRIISPVSTSAVTTADGDLNGKNGLESLPQGRVLLTEVVGKRNPAPRNLAQPAERVDAETDPSVSSVGGQASELAEAASAGGLSALTGPAFITSPGIQEVLPLIGVHRSDISIVNDFQLSNPIALAELTAQAAPHHESGSEEDASEEEAERIGARDTEQTPEIAGQPESQSSAPASDKNFPPMPADHQSVKPDPGRVLFVAPEGKGLERFSDGTLFVYNAELDAWMDETAIQYAGRVEEVLERLLNGPPSASSEPWHDFLPVPSGLETSRLLATTVLGSYGDITGQRLRASNFEIRTCTTSSRVDLRSILEKVMPVTWEDSPWSDKVLDHMDPGEGRPHRLLWETIDIRFRAFNQASAAWIEVEPSVAIDATKTGAKAYHCEDVEIDPETDEPRSRFADVAASIRGKPFPQEKWVNDNGKRFQFPVPLNGGASVLILGIGGSGKTWYVNQYVEWFQGRFPTARIFNFNAAGEANDPDRFKSVVRNMGLAEAEGHPCVFVCDEVQHLTAVQIERLGSCAAVVLAGDLRQSGSGERVHPVVPFALHSKAAIVHLDWVWRAANASLLNTLSYTFYDSALFALGRGDSKVGAPFFKYNICPDDAEIIAARCWAVAREFKAKGQRSLMLVIARDDVREALLHIAGSDGRPWNKGATSVQLMKPSQIQGREADVVLCIPEDFMTPGDDPARATRAFLTLVGRPRQELWLLFTRKVELETSAQRVFASLLRSFLEAEVMGGGLPPIARLDKTKEKFFSDLGFTAHTAGRSLLLAYRGCAIAFCEDHLTALARGYDQFIGAFAEQHNWMNLALFVDKNRSLSLVSSGSEAVLQAELQKRKDAIDRQIDGAT